MVLGTRFVLCDGNSSGVRMFAWGPDRFRKQPDHQECDDKVSVMLGKNSDKK